MKIKSPETFKVKLTKIKMLNENVLRAYKTGRVYMFGF